MVRDRRAEQPAVIEGTCEVVREWWYSWRVAADAGAARVDDWVRGWE